MGFLPTDKEIKEEVSNYDDLTFFKKVKNIYVAAIVIVCITTFFANNRLPGMDIDASGIIIYIILNLILAAFIFYNHRWAMIVFCASFVFDKVYIMFFQQVAPITQIIFGAIAIVLTYHSFRVATELKKNNL